jgi:hypothetical protein
MRWLNYVWHVAANCFLFFVVFYVLDRLARDKAEAVTVSTLGLIYVTIRTIAIGRAFADVNLFEQVHKQLFYLRRLLNDPDLEEAVKHFDASGKREQGKVAGLYIDSFFLLLIFLLCALTLFSSLPGN